MLSQIVVFLSLMYQAYGRKVQVPFCSSNTSLCTLSEDYNHLIPPRLNTSKPCQINPRIGISTIEVNEENHYVTLLLELKLDWIDHNLELVDYHSDWFQIDGTNFKGRFVVSGRVVSRHVVSLTFGLLDIYVQNGVLF